MMGETTQVGRVFCRVIDRIKSSMCDVNKETGKSLLFFFSLGRLFFLLVPCFAVGAGRGLHNHCCGCRLRGSAVSDEGGRNYAAGWSGSLRSLVYTYPYVCEPYQRIVGYRPAPASAHAWRVGLPLLLLGTKNDVRNYPVIEPSHMSVV